jgi:hypothetical protein
MTANQSPAEALDEAIQFLAKHIWEKAEFFASDEDEKRAEILYARKFMGQAVTAYAATVEREARFDELTNFNLPQYDHSKCPDPKTCIGYMNAESDFDNEKELRLAALQGPIQGDSK